MGDDVATEEHVLGEAWWTAYQPVSYQVESRLGTREEFAAMVTACNEAGMEVYADAVVNHMAGIDDAAPPATGWAGSTYTHYDYPGRYATEDFHRCGLTPDDDIADYRSSLQVRTCELVNLADLRTEEPAVRATITAYPQDLVSLGVRGLRIGAAKHMVPEDIVAILEPLPDDVEIIQEIIRGAGEPIVPEQYTGNGEVYEFAWDRDIIGMLQGGSLRSFADLGAGSGYLRSEFARVFVDNHYTERNASTLSYTDGASYVLANVLLLAGANGTPVVYSGYAFSERDAGPPPDASGAVLDATCATPSGPGPRVQLRRRRPGVPARLARDRGDGRLPQRHRGHPRDELAGRLPDHRVRSLRGRVRGREQGRRTARGHLDHLAPDGDLL